MLLEKLQIYFYFNFGKVFLLAEFQAKLFLTQNWVGGFYSSLRIQPPLIAHRRLGRSAREASAIRSQKFHTDDVVSRRQLCIIKVFRARNCINLHVCSQWRTRVSRELWIFITMNASILFSVKENKNMETNISWERSWNRLSPIISKKFRHIFNICSTSYRRSRVLILWRSRFVVAAVKSSLKSDRGRQITWRLWKMKSVELAVVHREDFLSMRFPLRSNNSRKY